MTNLDEVIAEHVAAIRAHAKSLKNWATAMTDEIESMTDEEIAAAAQIPPAPSLGSETIHARELCARYERAIYENRFAIGCLKLGSVAVRYDG